MPGSIINAESVASSYCEVQREVQMVWHQLTAASLLKTVKKKTVGECSKDGLKKLLMSVILLMWRD